ncbi:universal stress protein [Shewanella cyperi]|uniref:Universal stress protein n=1 Tax=Shewanella cyperi TaxID=2814292 RepID=A0A975ALG7_9GAMM|nr:universal stress protein [Shewanella cyperi]QSX30751.1 universal stress protein [Shewanella cyperi]QSX41528.1 universal stress protein [Shewanella cyperi]
MSRFQNLLAVTDESTQSRAALQKAIQLANLCHGNLTLLRVQLPEYQGVVHWLDQHLSHHDEQKNEFPRHDSYPNQDIKVRVKHCRAASLAAAVVNEIRQEDYDLLLVEHHHYAPWLCEFASTDDWQLLKDVALPVLFAGEQPWSSDGRILTALDIDDDQETPTFNRALLHFAGDLAELLHQQLHLLNCYQDNELGMSFSANQAPDEASHHWQKLRQLAEELALTDDRLHLGNGLPDFVIADTARACNSDIVVLGANAHEDWLSEIKGHTSQALLNQLQCDILALRTNLH